MKLRLKNFKSFKAGPKLTWNGLDEIEIDFTGKQGLIAFSGENGSSKTGALENLHHYPQLVSRDGALWQHVMGRKAEKEFISTFMGHEYRSLIKMDAEQGKQEGFLWIDGKPAVNGKITAYKEKVNEIFGQPFTYFRSQFCPQKSRKTSGMQLENLTPSVFHELLREFLNLQRYDVWEGTAKQAGNHYQGLVAGVDQRVVNLQENIGIKTEKEAERCAAGDKAGFLQDDRILLIHALEEKRQAVDALKATIQQNVLALQRKADLQAQIDRLEAELAKEKQTATVEIQVFSTKWVEIKNAITAAGAILKDREAIETAAETVRDLESGLTGLVAQLEEENQNVPVYQKRCHVLETEIAGLRQQVKDLDPMIDPENVRMGKLVDEAERAVKEREKEIKALDKDFQLLAIEAEIKNLERAALVGDGIDADCKSGTCAAIKSVNEAREKLPIAIKAAGVRKTEVEAEKETISIMIEEIKTKAAAVLREKALRIENIGALRFTIDNQIKATTHDLKNAQQVLLSTTELLTMHRADLATKRVEITKQKALADRLPDIRVAEQRKVDLEKQLAEVTEQGTARKEAWVDRENALKAMWQSERDKLDAVVVDFQAEMRLKDAQKEITEIETIRIPAVEKEIQAAREKIAILRAEIVRIEQAEKELAQVQEQRDLLTQNMSSWRYLQFGCGKTGLQNLRIDGAAPRIVYNANKLLSQAYGALYSIRLETINEAGKEDLQIKVIMENGQEIYLDDLSGGQRVWVVQALWLAMSLLNQEKSGKQFTYFCADENDGALDPENAEKFTALYRPFMEMAGLEQVIYISHKPSCRAMADHVLMFTHGKNPGWG